MNRIFVNSYLDNYLGEQLIIQEAKRMDININPDEIAQEKKKYLEKNDLTEDAFIKGLSSFKLSVEDVEQHFKNNLMMIRLGREKFGSKDISDEEARKYYMENKDDFNRPV